MSSRVVIPLGKLVSDPLSAEPHQKRGNTSKERKIKNEYATLYKDMREPLVVYVM